MPQLVNALLGAAGVTLGFAVWMTVKKQQPQHPHVHEWEAVIKHPCDPDYVCDALSIEEPLSSYYKFLFCSCGATVEMILCYYPNDVVTGNVVQFTDWQEVKLTHVD